MDPTDHVFGGRYRIVGEVGRGGMGVIYRGIDSVLDREVAIKVMSADFSDTTDEARNRFFREARAAAKLQHRNIVTVFEFAEQDGVPYIVMEFLKGRSLSARLAAQPPMSLEQKLDVMTELCNGLQFAHENGVIHRDVKPANVWILDDGAVKLVDFGIAKISSSMMTLRGDVMGSAAYMSPEQIEGQDITGRSDVFSAAVMLYEMVANRRPFEGDSPTATMMQIVHVPPPPIESLVPNLPRELIAAIGRGLEKHPDQRHQTAAEFGSDLQLIRMALPRFDETIVIQQPGSESNPGTLPLKPVPLPPKGTDPAIGTGLKMPSRNILLAAGAVILAVVVGFAIWGGGGDVADPPVQSGGPPPPPPPPQLRSFLVNSKPTGAEVLQDGTVVGTTPVEIKVAAGARFQLQKRGRETLDVQLAAGDLDRGSGTYELKMPTPTVAPPVAVRVKLEGSYDFAVYDGDREVSPPGQTHDFQSFEGRALTLVSEKYFLRKQIHVRAQRDRIFSDRAPGLGDVYFNGRESCLIYYGDRSLNQYAKEKLPQFAAGNHVFKVQCGSEPKQTYPVTVKAGLPITVTVK